jgi:hypothetical protein
MEWDCKMINHKFKKYKRLIIKAENRQINLALTNNSSNKLLSPISRIFKKVSESGVKEFINPKEKVYAFNKKSKFL